MGEILGDGLVLSFSDPSSVRAFDVCLRLGQEASYDVPDFGYSTEDLEWIYPLGLLVDSSSSYFYSSYYLLFLLFIILIIYYSSYLFFFLFILLFILLLDYCRAG